MHFLQPVVGIVAVAVDQLVGIAGLVMHLVDIAADQVIYIYILSMIVTSTGYSWNLRTLQFDE